MKTRDNPFSVECMHRIRYRPLDTTFEQILSRLDKLNYRAAIVGPEGSGKTTLLEDLQAALEQKGFKTRMVFANDTCPFSDAACRHLLSGLLPDEIVLLDGADAVSPSSWRLLRHRTIQHAHGLVITSHRRGRFPALIDCRTTPALLREIVDDLVAPGHKIPRSLLDRLYREHHGNIRDCLRDLYDILATDRIP
jgi:GTPase SAR1 family protein